MPFLGGEEASPEEDKDASSCRGSQVLNEYCLLLLFMAYWNRSSLKIDFEELFLALLSSQVCHFSCCSVHQ